MSLSAEEATDVKRREAATTKIEERESGSSKQKLSLNLTDEAAQVVRDLAAAKGTSVSEVIRRGISLEQFIIGQLDAGGTFLVRQRDGTLEAVHFVF